jgi:hypothetical protein
MSLKCVAVTQQTNFVQDFLNKPYNFLHYLGAFYEVIKNVCGGDVRPSVHLSVPYCQ